MKGRQVHHAGTVVLSLLMAVIGVALIVEVLVAGSSGLSARLLLGVLFIAAGVARVYLELRRGRGA